MSKVNILDCTLRDGGYVNNWNFSDESIVKIINALTQSNIDIIECGYITQKKGKASSSTLYKDINIINALLSNNNLNNSNSLFVVMLSLDEYNSADLSERNMQENLVTGIRLAFHKEKHKEALENAEKIISKGYDLYIQPIVISRYSDIEILKMISEFNNINYKGMYIVDSFGSISNYELERLLYIFDKNIKKDALLGFHSHNNMQLAYSNSINFINGITNREIITDSSIYGMGRGAGNLNTELLADYLNKNKQANYKLTNILEVIEFYIESIYNKNPWGFSLVHFLSATKGCHPNYASFFANKKISVVCIQEVLNDLDKDKKSVFDKEYAQKIYTEYIMKV